MNCHAFSTHRRNDLREFNRWRSISESHAGPRVQAQRDGVKAGLAVPGEVSGVR